MLTPFQKGSAMEEILRSKKRGNFLILLHMLKLPMILYSVLENGLDIVLRHLVLVVDRSPRKRHIPV